jgi:hypothetical protein
MTQHNLLFFVVFTLITTSLTHANDQRYADLVKLGHDQAMENLYGAKSGSKEFSKMTLGQSRDEARRDVLLAQEWEPIRITMDYDTMTDCWSYQKETLVENVFEPLRLKLQDLIKVKRSPGGVSIPSNLCVETAVNDGNRGAPNSDLHLFITCVNAPGWNVAQYAAACQFDPGSFRPNAGQVTVNVGAFNFNTSAKVEFEANIATTMHEVTHVLGFSA